MTFYLYLGKIKKIGCVIVIKKRNSYIKRALLTLITLGIIGFIFGQSLLSGEKSSEQSGWVVAFLNSISSALGLGEIFAHDFVRTCAHFLEFALLSASALLMYFSYIIRKPVAILSDVLTCPVVALIDECIQLFTKDRAFQFSDIFIDVSGATCGLLVTLFIYLFVTRILMKKNKEE